jgi:demethylspheroidene O-methyltransferase
MKPQLSWWDRCVGLVDRLFASPRFQRWATGFPLTRPIARRRARGLFDLVAGFVYSQVLLAAVRLQLFEILRDGPQTLAELAPRLGLPEPGAARLLDAAVALRLAERRRRGRYGLGPLGHAMVGNPGIAAMIEHHGLLYADLADPVALLRGDHGSTALGGYWPYADAAGPAALTPAQVAGYTDLMSASQPFIAAEVLDAYDIRAHRCLLDVGGGDGRFLTEAASRAPALRLMLFDLPAVAARAAARFAESGLSARASAVGGDFRTDGLPQGADLVSLVRILHDHDDATVRALLRAVRACLPAGGTLLVAEPLAATSGAEPVGDAYFGFYLMAMGRGRPRRATELAGMMAEAGFDHIRVLRTRSPMLTGLLLARVTGSSRLV